jgi:hypothetical protein
MTNKRQLKKHIRYVCGELAVTLLIANAGVRGFDTGKTQDIVGKIATLQETSIAHVSICFDKIAANFDSRKAYNAARAKYFATAYAKLLNEFNNQIQEIVKEMNAAMPQEARDAIVKDFKEHKKA